MAGLSRSVSVKPALGKLGSNEIRSFLTPDLVLIISMQVCLSGMKILSILCPDSSPLSSLARQEHVIPSRAKVYTSSEYVSVFFLSLPSETIRLIIHTAKANISSTPNILKNSSKLFHENRRSRPIIRKMARMVMTGAKNLESLNMFQMSPAVIPVS